jgi:sugar O-acyltransferase (sialic acid O-acetyltransferase NeuD family)
VKLLLVGAGGHARTVVDALNDNGHEILAYTALDPSTWLDAPYLSDEDAKPGDFDGFVMGVGGVMGDMLAARLELFRAYQARGFEAVTLIHSTAYVAPGAAVADGATILPRSAINLGAVIGPAAIINTGAIVEHDVRIGAGAHVAPGAVVLGAAHVGDNAMIGAGAVVLPGGEVIEGALVPALRRHPL